MTLFARKKYSTEEKAGEEKQDRELQLLSFLSVRSKKEKSISNSVLVNFII